MKKLIIIAILFSLSFGFSLELNAQNPGPLNNTQWIRTAYDSEAITIDSTAGGIGFTSSLINPTCTNCSPGTSRASAAQCTLETGDIRISLITADAPTSSVGTYITAGQSFVIYGYANISVFKGIRVTGTSGLLNCTYFR